MVTDPQKLMTPPAQLFLSRAHCYLRLARPLEALSDANKAINLDNTCLLAKITKAESLYNLLMFEKALVMFTRLLREKPDNKASKMGSVKCSQAIENSIAEDCFDVPNIEEIFKSTLSSVTTHDSISPDYEVPEDKKLDQNLEDSSKSFELKSNTKEEAKDFLGPLRNYSIFPFNRVTNLILSQYRISSTGCPKKNCPVAFMLISHLNLHI